jgi:hypothetical protein
VQVGYCSEAAREYESERESERESEAGERGAVSDGGFIIPRRRKMLRMSKLAAPSSYSYAALAKHESDFFVDEDERRQYLLEQLALKGRVTRSARATRRR